MRKTLYAELSTKTGHEKLYPLQNVFVDENGGISPRSYDKAKRKAFKILSENNCSTSKKYKMNLVLSDGRRDTFGGYPAFGFIVNKVIFK